MHTKRYNTFFKRWVKFRVGVIPRLPSMVLRVMANFSNQRTLLRSPSLTTTYVNNVNRICIHFHVKALKYLLFLSN